MVPFIPRSKICGLLAQIGTLNEQFGLNGRCPPVEGHLGVPAAVYSRINTSLKTRPARPALPPATPPATQLSELSEQGKLLGGFVVLQLEVLQPTKLWLHRLLHWLHA